MGRPNALGMVERFHSIRKSSVLRLGGCTKYKSDDKCMYYRFVTIGIFEFSQSEGLQKGCLKLTVRVWTRTGHSAAHSMPNVGKMAKFLN